MLLDMKLIKKALICRCPRCGGSPLYDLGWFNFALRDRCKTCDLDFKDNDVADGPAVFLIFILGFTLVPLAWLFEIMFTPPLWSHVVLACIVGLGIIVITLRPLTSYILALEFKHRTGDIDEN